MILRSLQITNFRSFRGRQVFEFPRGAGLYFLWGRNEAEPRLEANGSGKSSLWKALTWLFFAKDDDGLGAGDIANWGIGKKTSVVLEYLPEPDGVPVFVERTWSPNSWTYRDLFGNVHDLTKDGANQLRAELRLDYSSFLACAVMAQNRPMFLDMKASDKATLFADVMGLDQWLDYSEAASAKAKDADGLLRAAEGRVAMLRGSLEQTRREDVVSRRDDWEARRKTRLASLAHEYQIVLARISTLKIRHGEMLRAQEDARDLVAEASRAANEAATHNERLKKQTMGDMPDAGATCPTCGQGIRQHFAAAIKTRSAADDTYRKAQQALRDAEGAVRNVEREIASANAALDNMEAREDDIVEEANPFDKLQRDQVSAIKRLEADLRAALRSADELSERYSIHSHLVRWFKEVRLGLIGEALDQLEIEVNGCVNELGLDGWELRFEVDKETAKGTIQRGFNVFVRSPHNTKPVPWEAWSGGEGQRLRIAGNMGLANLIRARTGATINVEVWDEPTNGLSAQGTQDLLEGLAARAAAEQRQIWVVDHRTLGYAGFAGASGVVKTKDGSKFVRGSQYSYEHESARQSAAGGEVLHGPRRRAVSTERRT